jgi:hypothetical protein
MAAVAEEYGRLLDILAGLTVFGPLADNARQLGERNETYDDRQLRKCSPALDRNGRRRASRVFLVRV